MGAGRDFVGDAPIDLEVVPYNARAIAFYRRQGFETVAGRERDKDEIPVIRMVRSLRS